MPIITIEAELAQQLSDAFADVSRTVVKYMHDNFKTLSMGQYEQLSGLQFKLRDTADDLLTDAVGIVLDSGRGDIDALKGAAGSATKALKKIADVKKAIKVATAVLALVMAIPTGDLDNIYSALNDVITGVKA